MPLQLHTQANLTYNDIDFVIKAFHDSQNASYVIKAFFADGKAANNLSYSVKYNDHAELLASTGDDTVALLIQHAKDDILSDHYFINN